MISNKYEVQDDVVGRGAWSVVKKCCPIPPYTPPNVQSPHPASDGSAGNRTPMKYVVKIIEKEYLISLTKGDVDRAMAEVYRELEVLRHIPAHKNVVAFVEYFENDKNFFLIFEEVHCGDLCEIVLKSKDGRLDEETAKKYTCQVIRAVLHCHINGVVHRDIKPENLLVNDHGEIKLTDFGLAKLCKGPKDELASAGSASTSSLQNPSATTVAGLIGPYPGCEKLSAMRCVCSDVIGTPRYGAPEMFYAKSTQTNYDGFKADTWSVGVVAYIILSGSFPFSAAANSSEKDTYQSILRTQLTFLSSLSHNAVDFVQRLLQKDPEKRMTLWDALDHPWLEPLAERRGSETVAQFRRSSLSEDEGTNQFTLQKIYRAFDNEAALLHQCIAKLRREALQAKWDADKSKLRAETPPPGARGRVGGSVTSLPSPTTAARGSSPGRTGSASGHSTTSSIHAARGLFPVARSSPGRPASSPSESPSSKAVGAAPARNASPLARSTPNTLRRGTPSRVPAPVPANGALGSISNNTSGSPASTPKRPVTPGRVTPNRLAGGVLPRGSPTPPSVNAIAANTEFEVGENVIYKGAKATIHFFGTTSFGPGVWLGVEMMEGNEGTNDGTSFVDKKRYFSCPRGKGVFLRTSQVKKMDS